MSAKAIRVLRAFCLLVSASAAVASAQAEGDLERAVKAAFLCNFAKYTDWPPDAFKGRDDPLVICVVGDDPFGKVLDDTVRDQTVNNRPIVVQRVARVQDVPSCHILFVSSSERRRLPNVFEKVRASSTLTVGDCDGFAQSGGTIGLFLEEGKVRFAINVAAAERARLKLSSQLLKLARLVNEQR